MLFQMETWKQAFAIDYRSLRLFRLLLGFGLLLEALSLSFAINDFFTDKGLYPRLMIFQMRYSYELWTPLNLYGEWWWPALWMVLLAGLGALMVAGRWTRLCSLLSFFVLHALILRCPLIFYGSDKLLQAACLWSAFLPSSRKPGDTGETFFSAVSVCAMGQLAVLYAVAGFAKSAEYWWDWPVASYLAMQGDAFVSPIGKTLTAFPEFLAVSTRGVWLLERFGWILFLVPWKDGVLRFAIVALFAMMHAVFGICLHLELFPYMDVMMLSLALPPFFWNSLAKVPRLVHMKTAEEPAASWRGWWTAISEPAAMVSLALIFWVTLHTIPGKPVRLPERFENWLRITGLHQTWSLFAPYPYIDDGWYTFLGKTRDGRTIDLLTRQEGPVSLQHPGSVVGRNPNYRWTSFLFQMRTGPEPMLRRMGEFFCDQRRDVHGELLDRVEIYYTRDPTMPPGSRMRRRVEKRHTRDCSGFGEPVTHTVFTDQQ